MVIPMVVPVDGIAAPHRDARVTRGTSERESGAEQRWSFPGGQGSRCEGGTLGLGSMFAGSTGSKQQTQQC